MQSRYWILAVLTAACTTGDNAPATAIVSTATEPAGMNCAAGGVAINSGIDRNDNGTLDPDEITATSYVCAGAGGANGTDGVNGTNGINGSNGSNGSNGTNGTNGSNGSDGANAVIAIVAEPPGANCAAGGQAIEAGIDTNDNNVLDASEVTSVTYLCNATNPTTIEGSVTVQNSLQAAQLVGVQHITGNLLVDAAGLTSIDLHALVTVGGNFEVRSFSGTTIAAPLLTSVTGNLTIDPMLASVDLSTLGTVGGGFGVYNTAAVIATQLTSAGSVVIAGVTSDVSLPLLASEGRLEIDATATTIVVSLPVLVHGHGIYAFKAKLDAPVMQDVDAVTFDSVTALSVPALISAGTVTLQGTSLDSFPFSQLTSLANVVLNTNATAITVSSPLATMTAISIHGLGALDLPNLTTVQSLSIRSSPSTTLGLPALQSAGQLTLDDNASLTTLAFPALTSTGYIEIISNPTLSQCDAQNLQTATQPWPYYYYNIYLNGPC